MKTREQKSMIHLIALGAFFTLVPSSVQGAICSEVTSTTCEATNLTLASCDRTTMTCGCKPGYFPIPTGCATRLPTPAVTLPTDRTTEIIIGTSGRLDCRIPSSLFGIVVQWKLDGVDIPDATSPIHYISMESESSARHYSCALKYRESEVSPMDSEESERVEITVVTEISKSKNIPQVSGIPGKAAEGASLKPSCINIPINAGYSFILDDGRETTEVITSMFSGLKYNSSIHKNIKCVLDVSKGDFFTTVESPKVKMPVVATAIDNVTITTPHAIGSEYVVKTDTFAVVHCLVYPRWSYMRGRDSTKFEFTFVDSSGPTSIRSYSSYIFKDDKPQIHNIFCTVTYDGNEPMQSGNVTVRFSDDYIKNATLIASGTLLLPRSRLVLTCGASQDGVTYTWFKDRRLVVLAKDRILQIGNFTSSNAAMYECEATINNYETKSSVIVQVTDTLDQPVIESADLIGGTTLGADGDFMLVCFTASATAGMKYSWKRNGTDLTNPSRIYMIKGASARQHNGEYMCTASFLDQGDTSPSLYLTIVPAGKVCTPANVTTECSGEGYKEICDDEGRCACDTGWYKKGHGCAKSSTTPTVVISALQVLVVITLCALL